LSTPPRDIDSGHKFDSLFADHYLAVYRYCLRRLGPADSEDAAAEVFAVAWRRLEQVPTGEPVRPWLLAVAYRVVGNHYRGRRRRVRLSARLGSEREQVVEPEASDPEIRLLRRALDSLRSADRELLRLSAWDGLSNAEIAAVMGVNQNAVDQRLFRARARLRGRFDQLILESRGANARKAAT
jgi:RNA polymerase sigma-70 factor (ECF subfamily)